MTNQLINCQPIHPPTPLLNQSINHLEAEPWNGETFDKQIASAGGPAVSSHDSNSVPVPETHTHSFFKVSATRPLQTRNTNHPRHSYNSFHRVHASLTTTSYCLSLPSTPKTPSQTACIPCAGYLCYLRRPRGRNEIHRAFKTPDSTGRKERFLPYWWNQLPATIDCFSIYYAGDPSVATLRQEGVFLSFLPGPCRNTATRIAR